jgi:two-component system cell cycle response regulator DivK
VLEVAVKTILVVEDDEPSLKLVRSFLSRERHRVLGAKNVQEALDLAGRERPDLILMDLGLAGIDGFTATRMIKSDPQLRSIPVLALSAEADAQARAAEAGCSGCIAKPFQIKQFLAIVRRYLA